MNLTLSEQRRHARRLTDVGQVEDAIAAFQTLLAETPADAEAWYELGWLLRRSGQADAALHAYAQALANGISGAEEVHLNRAVIQTDLLHDHVAAESSLHESLEVAPGYVPAHLNLGNLYEDLGRTGEAEVQYRAVLAAAPVSAAGIDWRTEALARVLALPGPSTSDDALLRDGIALARSPLAINTKVRASLWFACGRALEARSTYDEAFDAFVQANLCASDGGPAYSTAEMEAAVDALVANLELQPLPHGILSSNALQPLFICGMFRSGSTLIEQVLAAHPEVLAGGERAFFPALAGGALAPDRTAISQPHNMDCAALAAEYLAQSARLAPVGRAQARWFTDKRPDNVLLLDHITRVFPKAKILLTRRNPVDNGLSLFQQHLDQRQVPYSSDLRAIGHYSVHLDRWIQTCVKRLGDQIHVFDYDAFVREPEAELRPLLTWLGLEWDARCLAFDQHARSVKTASAHQVRRPLYADSSGRWRAYGRHLQPLVDVLQDAGLVDAEGRRRN